MTLVVDEGSASKAKAMVGSLSSIMKQNMDDFDTISDNLFGGIPIKLQQAFAGFLEALKKPLLALTDLVTRVDFAPLGRSLGDWLMWAWQMFSQLIKSGDIWQVVGLQLQRVFISGVAILSTALDSAFRSFFSPYNLQQVGFFFEALGRFLGAAIAESLPAILGGGANENRTTIKNEGLNQMRTALVNAPAFAMKSLQDFGTDLANWRADTAFAPVLQKLEDEIAGFMYQNAAFAGISPIAPAINGPSMSPGATTSPGTIFNQRAESKAAANESQIMQLLSKIADHTGATANEVADLAFE
jgi:hypothetical protein